MRPELRERILHESGSVFGLSVKSLAIQPVSGGSINQVYKISINNDLSICCKVNSANKFPEMFAEEASGLEMLRKTGVIRIPRVYSHGVFGPDQFLLMEWIPEGTTSEAFWKIFGEQLASLHSFNIEADRQYGFTENNYMGALTQDNFPMSRWPEFFFQRRIQPQLKLAVDKGMISFPQAKLFDILPLVLENEFPASRPSLVHGDLWSGNFLCSNKGEPVLIDPAVYYGLPAVDLGLTTLFGGYDNSFYQSYNFFRPFPANYRRQWEICNLYPLLIHLNLFGRSYLPELMEIIGRYSK